MTMRPWRTAAVVAVLCAAAWAQTAEVATPQPSLSDLSLHDLSEQAWPLASQGRLPELWQALQQRAPASDEQSPTDLASLRRYVSTYQAHEQRRRAEALAAYNEQLAELDEQLASGKLIKALATAVDAHDLAERPAELLARDEVDQLVRQSVEKAVDAEAVGNWLEALSLYRGLGLLFDDHATFTVELKRVARRVRLLRMYAPDVLFKLYEDHAARHGDEPPKPWPDEEEHWRKELDEINLAMLHRAINFGVEQYVAEASYRRMLIGGADALLAMLETKGLETTFEGLGDQHKRLAFADHLETMKQEADEREEDYSYRQVWTRLKQLRGENRATVELPDEVLIYEFAQGAMATLDDFTDIIWPAQVPRFERLTKGEFSGVGIQITLSPDGQLAVVSPLEDTPAHRAQIKAGDRIVSVDGRSTAGISLERAVEQITGDPGTEVTLGIQSPGEDEARSVVLTRSRIRIVSVKGWQRKPAGGWDFIIDPQLNIGYIRMTAFSEETADEMDRAVQAMKARGDLNALVLDLRFNPGGLLDAAVEVSNRFLASGVIVYTPESSGGRTWSASGQHTYHRNADDETSDFPVTVLINAGSASASEIVAGCLQTHNRALIVGQRSYGKGSVQNVFRLRSRSSNALLKLTTQYYRMPDGRIIHRRPKATDWGISPDVVVKMTNEEVKDLIEARMFLDVLRDEGVADEGIVELLMGAEESDDESEDGAEAATQPAEAPRPLVNSADELLERGMDPQLEAALLLLRTRLIGEQVDS